MSAVSFRPSGLSSLHSTPSDAQCQLVIIGAQDRDFLNKLPERLQGVKRALQDIWMAETRHDAEAAFDAFAESYGAQAQAAARRQVQDSSLLQDTR
jgi:hypothetical protein